MKKRMIKLLSLAMSGVLTLSSLSTLTALAAPEDDDFEDVLEDKFEAEIEQEENDESAETDETDLNIEEEDAEIVEANTAEPIPPSGVKWEDYGLLAFNIESSEPFIYGADIYRNGEMCGGWSFGDCYNFTDEDGLSRHNVADYFEGSGTYSAKVYVKKDDSLESEEIFSSEVPEIVWTQPDQRVATPGNPHWEYRDSEHFAVAVCDPVEHAYRYWFDLYDGDKWLAGYGSSTNEEDFSHLIGDVSEHNYYFVVRQVVSNDLSQYANALKSEESLILTLNGSIVHTQKDIVDLGKDVNASNVDEMVQQVKDLDNSTLKTSLQTSDEALASMAKIEDEYKESKGINVLPSTSDVDKIPADKIEMTGAALNVSKGSVQLNVRDSKDNGSGIINTDIYTNIIAFDMSVESSEGIDFSKELEVPVTISMPIPSGMNTSVMVILHYRADGTEELITPRIENGNAIFAITHFSTFAFAEKKDSANTADVPDGPAPRIIVNTDGTSKVYRNGVEIPNYTGLAMLGTAETAPWVYVENNKRNETYSGYVEYNGALFYVGGGTMASEKSGLVQDPNHPEDWYFLAGGQAQTQYTGLAQYDGAWFYVENGKLNTKLAAFVEYDGGLFFVGAGRIMKEVNGLAMDPNGSAWYYLAAGQAQISYTGLAFYDGAWFYVVSGKLAQDYTGNVEYDGSTFYVENGMVQ